MKTFRPLVALVLLIPVLGAVEIIEPAELKSRRSFYAAMVDGAGNPTIGIDLFVGGYVPPLSMERMASFAPRSCPEALVREQFLGLQKGDLEAVLALYEEGASRKEATRQFSGHMDKLSAMRKGGSISIISKVRVGPVVSIYFNNTWSDGTTQVWWETMRLGDQGWAFAKGFGNSHFLTNAVNLQSRSKGTFTPAPEMRVVDVSIGADGKGVVVPTDSDKYAAKIAVKIERFAPPLSVEEYDGKDTILVFLKDTIAQYRSSVPAKTLNERWTINSWEAFSDERPIDLLGWFGNPRTESNQAMVHGRIASKQGWLYLVGNTRALTFLPVLVSKEQKLTLASGIIEKDALEMNVMLLIDQTLEKATFHALSTADPSLAPPATP
jgi:hypothetical protein